MMTPKARENLAAELRALQSDNDRMKRALVKLNGAIDAFWNDHTYGLGFTGMGENHMKAISEAQQDCLAAITPPVNPQKRLP